MTRGTFIVAAWGGFLATLTFWLYMDIGHARAAAWCATANADCVRDWISAFSGWAAAAAALATISVLLQQAEHARRQTDFVLGDALPELVLTGGTARWVLGATLHVTNLNRRDIHIERIRAIGDNFTLGDEVVYRGKTPEVIVQMPMMIRFDVDGWFDRSRPAPSGYAQLRINRTANEASDTISVELEVTYVLLGNEHVRLTQVVSHPSIDPNT